MYKIMTLLLAALLISASSTAMDTDGKTVSRVVCEVGDIIYFGSYEQDNDSENGMEPIVWIVLEIQEDRMLLISKYGLDAQPYNEDWAKITWEECTLRAWLNGEFLKTAFTTREQKAILMNTVDNSMYQGYSEYTTFGGNNTRGKVFLLSYAEAWKYFINDADRQCKPTVYAVARGINPDIASENCWWWLRSPGFSPNCAALVNRDGSRCIYSANNDYEAVRPAMWVDPGFIR